MLFQLRKKWYVLIPLILVAVVYLFTAGGMPIYDDGDALYSHISQRMAMTGDWVTPYADGERFLDKPPILYWLTAASYHVFGYHEFAARFPSVLAVLGIVGLLCALGRRAGGVEAGFIAGAASAFCIGTFLFTRMVFPDVFFVFFLTLALTAFLGWHRNERNPVAPALLFYAAMAGAVLSKGLIGLFFPAAIICLFLFWSRDFRRLKHFHIGKGTVLFLVLALPWHILAAVRNPGFLWYYFINEQVLRFLGRRQPVDYESISLPIFWALILVWLFPWSVFLPAIRHVWREAVSRSMESRDIVRLCVCWAFVILVFFSISSRIEHYSMPLFPPLALLTGVALSSSGAFAVSTRRSVAWGFAALGILGLVIALLTISGVVWLSLETSGQPMDEISASRTYAYKYYFGPLFEMPADIVSRLKAPLIGTCCLLALGLTGAWLLNRKGARLAAVVALNLVMAGFCFFTWQSLGICGEILSSRQFGQKLEQLYREGDIAVVLGDFETANSINFYSSIPLHVYKGSAALLQWGMSYPDAPQRLFSEESFESRWQSEERTFLLTPDDQADALKLPFSYTVMRSGNRVLFCNQKIP